jgi:hypothetical protein
MAEEQEGKDDVSHDGMSPNTILTEAIHKWQVPGFWVTSVITRVCMPMKNCNMADNNEDQS